jgi:hypothetical protein
MKIELTKAEVAEILLEHINFKIANCKDVFNTVSFGTYYSTSFESATISYVAPEVADDQA